MSYYSRRQQFLLEGRMFLYLKYFLLFLPSAIH